MRRSDYYHFFLTSALLLTAVFLLDYFATQDSTTGYYVYKERGELDISNSVKPATPFSMESLLERQQQPRTSYSRDIQLRQCHKQCGICEENQVCLPIYKASKGFGIPALVRTCSCLPKSSDN